MLSVKIYIEKVRCWSTRTTFYLYSDEKFHINQAPLLSVYWSGSKIVVFRLYQYNIIAVLVQAYYSEVFYSGYTLTKRSN